jgi:hypothetical protein
VTTPRLWDYPVGINLEINRRIGVCEVLRNMVTSGEGVLAPVIEARKDQLLRIPWEFQVRGKPDQDDPRIEELNDFFQSPDHVHDFQTWLRMLLHDMFTIDAPSIYCWKKRNGKPHRLDVLDGATLQILVDDAGRIPDPPNPAFAQIIKGLPMVEFTRDEILYAPRNPLPYAPIYGFSPVQQIALRMVSMIRKELYVFDQWTEGNVPDLIMGAPETYTPGQIADLQSLFDTLLSGNLANRTRMRVIPGGVKPLLAKGTARIICFAFSIPPTSFVSMMNRATSQQLQDEADSEGLYPLMQWARALMNQIIAKWFGYPDIEFVWDIQADVDQAQQSQTLTRYVNAGVMTRNEARDSLGLPPDPDGDVLMVSQGATVTPLKFLVNAPPPQPKQVGGVGAMNGANGRPPIATTATPLNGDDKPARALPSSAPEKSGPDDDSADSRPAAKLIAASTAEKKSLLRPSTNLNRDWLNY